MGNAGSGRQRTSHSQQHDADHERVREDYRCGNADSWPRGLQSPNNLRRSSRNFGCGVVLRLGILSRVEVKHAILRVVITKRSSNQPKGLCDFTAQQHELTSPHRIAPLRVRGSKKNSLRNIEVAGVTLVARQWLQDCESLRGLTTPKGAKDAKDELARTKAENERFKKELESFKEVQAKESKRIKRVLSERKEQGLSGIGKEPLFSEEYWEAHQNMSPEARKVQDEEDEAFTQTAKYQEEQRELEQARIEEGLGLNTTEPQ